MARRLRIEIPDGTYYVVQRGGARRTIFSGQEDYVLFEQLLAAAVRRHGATVYAYCWTPDAIHMVLRTSETPLGRFMQGLTSRYARSIHRREGESGHFFRSRYQAALIDSDAYLCKLVHYVQYIPVLTGLSSTPAQYEHTSHRVYLGMKQASWMNIRSAPESLCVQSDTRHEYDALMAQSPAEHDVELFRNGGEIDLRVIGGSQFIETLPRRARKYRSKLSVDEVIYNVSRALGVPREHVTSSSRRRELALARALIGWFAIERHIATLTEVARRLNRDPSTLSVAITRYRELRPDLFRLDSLHYLTPIGGAPVVSDRRSIDGEEARVG